MFVKGLRQLFIASLQEVIDGNVSVMRGPRVGRRCRHDFGQRAFAESIQRNRANLAKELPV